jgi:hypothetical protein
VSKGEGEAKPANDVEPEEDVQAMEVVEGEGEAADDTAGETGRQPVQGLRGGASTGVLPNVIEVANTGVRLAEGEGRSPDDGLGPSVTAGQSRQDQSTVDASKEPEGRSEADGMSQQQTGRSEAQAEAVRGALYHGVARAVVLSLHVIS